MFIKCLELGWTLEKWWKWSPSVLTICCGCCYFSPPPTLEKSAHTRRRPHLTHPARFTLLYSCTQPPAWHHFQLNIKKPSHLLLSQPPHCSKEQHHASTSNSCWQKFWGHPWSHSSCQSHLYYVSKPPQLCPHILSRMQWLLTGCSPPWSLSHHLSPAHGHHFQLALCFLTGSLWSIFKTAVGVILL